MDMKIVRKERKQAGLCTLCGGKKTDQYATCHECRSKHAVYRMGLRANNICDTCGRKNYRNGPICEKCVGEENKRLSALSLKRDIANICRRCGKPSEYGSKSCRNCRDKHNARIKKRIEQGLCQCGRESLPHHCLCEKHYFESKARSNLHAPERWQEIKDLYYNQSAKCAITGLPMVLGNDEASLDHIISKANGGTDNIDNLQWIMSWINQWKWIYSMEEFKAKVKILAIVFGFTTG